MDGVLILRSSFCVFAALILIFAFTPYIAKKDSLFGVYIGKEMKKHTEIKQYSHYYSFCEIMAGLCMFLLCCYSKSMPVFLICVIIYIVFSVILFSLCGKLVKNIIKVENMEKLAKPIYVKVESESTSIKGFSPLWNLFALLLLLPLIYISQGSLSGFGAVIPVVCVIVTAAAVISGFLINKAAVYAKSRDILEECAENSRIRRIIGIFILIANILINAILFVLQLDFLEYLPESPVIEFLPFALPVVITVLIIIFCCRINKD